MKLGILKEFKGNEIKYIKACEDLDIDYEIIDIMSSNWLNLVKSSDVDGFLVRPSIAKRAWKEMYDERIYFIDQVLKKPIYPSYKEIFIYENKKNMAYFLESMDIPHAKTYIFYKKKEALNFIENEENYPLIFKPGLGSAALGIKFIYKKSQAKSLINKVFTKYKFYNRGFTKWYKTKYKISYPMMDDKQYNFILFQEKLNIKTEWRIIKIGESYFGHQKLSDGKFHSGSGLVGWIAPPDKLMDFALDIFEKGQFTSMDIDIFEDNKGNYYVNELQTYFGSYNDSQMYINDIPGRYIHKDDKWIFEEGYFNQNGSCNLRVKDFISKLES